MPIKYALVILFVVVAMQGFSQIEQKAKINHTAIYVVNLQASKHFYGQIIGLDTLADPFKDGKHAWFKTGQNIALHVIQGATEKKDYYKNQHTCFSVASVQSFKKTLQQNNINWEDVNGKMCATTTRIDGVQQIWLQDPDGYWVEINDAKF